MIGCICYDVHSGLGHLAKSFYDNGLIDKVLIIPHPRYKRYPEWYDRSKTFSRQTMARFLEGLKTLLVFENAFNCWDVVSVAKSRGVKFVLVPMYEWSEFPPKIIPDLVICASDIDVDYYREYKHVRLNIPVDKPWRLRTRALSFVHNAGHGQVGFAKGTPEVLKALEFVKSPITLTLRGQPGEPRIKELFHQCRDRPKVRLAYGDLPEEELFSVGDVFINAERYNGLSLPLQEARASGMLVMTTDRYPANTWLPTWPLIPVASYDKHKVNHTTFDRATIDPRAVAAKIDEVYGMEIIDYSHSGKVWAEENSWKALKSRYEELLRG